MSNDKQDKMVERVVESAEKAREDTTHPMTEREKQDLREYITEQIKKSNEERNK